MEKVFFLAGLGGSIGGVCLLIYQGLMYLMHNDQTKYTVLSVVDKGPESFREAIYASPQIANALGSCPLFIAVIAVGLLFLYIGSKLNNRYV